MTPPRLESVLAAHVSAAQRAAVPPGAGPVRWFRVGLPGQAFGRDYAVGDVLICGGHAHVGDAVVVVPRGRGVPRVGRLTRGGLLGDLGEFCNESRWGIVGRVVATVSAPSVPVRRQLDLFAAA